MTAKQLVQEFREMLGWAYRWGDAKRGSVDCSGAFVYAFRQHGLKIYHGSNTIWRNYLSAKGRIGEIPLVPGAAVFKWREDGEPAQFRNDGEDDFYHIGLYIGDGKVIEAKSVKYGCVESGINSGWTHEGYLKDVEYEEEEERVEEIRMAVVVAESGSTVNVRREPNGQRIGRIPLGEKVEVYTSEGGWSSVAYKGGAAEAISGYVKTEFLAFAPDEAQDGEAVFVPDGVDIVKVEMEMPREWAKYIADKFKEAAEVYG